MVGLLVAGTPLAAGAEKSTADWRSRDVPFPKATWITNGKLKYTTSWIGNSFGGPEWVQKDGMGLGVGPDGTCFVPASWDEAGKGIGIYKDGKAVGHVQNVSSANGAAAVGEKYAYVCLTRDNTQGMGRFNLDGSPAPWGDVGNFLPVGKGWQAGAALGEDAFGNDVLYATDTAGNAICVFDLKTKKELRRFPCDKPWRLTVDKQRNVWVISGQDGKQDGHPTIIQFSPDGKPTGKVIRNVDGANALAVDSKNRLLVAGPHHQVLKYDISRRVPRVIGSLGVKDGIYAGRTPGVMGDDRGAFLWGVGVDANDNIYTFGRFPSGGGGVDLRKFSPGAKLLWRLVSTQFIDLADVDPGSERGDKLDVYTRDECFQLDFSKAPGQQWTWKGYTVDPRFDDSRIDDNYNYLGMFALATPRVCRLQGRKYLYLFSNCPYMAIYRQGKGEILEPSGVIDFRQLFHRDPKSVHYVAWPPALPKEGRWAWRDTNGDGMVQADEYDIDPLVYYMNVTVCVDAAGDLWIKGYDEKNWKAMWHWPMAGFDEKKNPIYRPADMKRIEFPKELTESGGLFYDPATDVMYVSGQTKERQSHSGLGAEIIRYDNWRTPKRKVHCRIVLPHSTNENEDIRSMTVAGGRVFCNRRFKGLVFVYDADTGEKLGEMSAGPEIASEHGWPDMAYSLSSFVRKNGETLLFMEDDWKSKIVMYRLLPK